MKKTNTFKVTEKDLAMMDKLTEKVRKEAEAQAKADTVKITKATLHEMVTEANNVENACYIEAIPSVILTQLKKENDEIFSNSCKALANKTKKAFFKMFFQTEIAKGLNDKEIVQHIKEAISCKQYSLVITDDGLIDIDTTTKPISFADVVKAKAELIAFAHANQEVTKEDKIKANKFYFGDFGKGYLDIITHNSRVYMSIGNADDTTEAFTLNANFDKSMTMLDEKYAKLKKDNPFKLNSNNAYTLQIMDIVEYFTDNTDIKLFNYHCKAVFQMVCSRNKYGKLTIANAYTVLDSIATVYRYAYNGYKLPTTDKSDIYKTIK